MYDLERAAVTTDKAEGLLADEAPIYELDELQGLIADAQESGFLTLEQVQSCLEEVEVTKEQVTELHVHLTEQGIDIIGPDGKPVVVKASASTAPEDRKEIVAEQRKPQVDLTVEPSLDSLRLYLRSIGKVP